MLNLRVISAYSMAKRVWPLHQDHFWVLMVRGWIPNFAILSILSIFIISHSSILLYFIGLFLNSQIRTRFLIGKSLCNSNRLLLNQCFCAAVKHKTDLWLTRSPKLVQCFFVTLVRKRIWFTFLWFVQQVSVASESVQIDFMILCTAHNGHVWVR